MMMKTKLILLAFAAYASVGTLQAADPRNTCINNMRMLDSATDQAAIEGGLNTGDVVPAHVVSEYIRGGIGSVKCPAKGTYSFGTIGKEPICSIHGSMSEAMTAKNGLGTREVFGREPATDAEIAMDEIVMKMSRDQGKFDPEILKRKGADGMRSLADRLFPQSATSEGATLSRKEFETFFSELGAEKFEVRVEAERRLTMGGGLYRREVESATRSSDPEIVLRANAILKAWDARLKSFAHVDFIQYSEALAVYLSKIEDKSLRNELALRAQRAKEAGVINPGQMLLIDICLPRETGVRGDTPAE